MNNKGIIPIATVLLVLAGIAVLSGVFYYSYESALPSVLPAQTASSTTPIANPTSTTPASASTTPTSTTPYLAPTSGAVGSMVTIHGSGFAATGNTVTFSELTAGSMKDLASSDGRTITFKVPSDLGPNCKPNEACAQFLLHILPGNAYAVAVITGDAAEPIGKFTVTGTGGGIAP